MGQLGPAAIAALESFVGPMAASTCVRATALSLGKTSDELGRADWPDLQSSIRRLLGPVATESVIDKILHQIEGAI